MGKTLALRGPNPGRKPLEVASFLPDGPVSDDIEVFLSASDRGV